MSDGWSVLWAVLVVAAAILGGVGWVVWRKGRSFAPGDVFHASRLSAGNHLFPTQVLISPTSIVQERRRANESAHRAVSG